jgi:phosphoenolpyruvate carboxykinase (ATP)
MNVKGIQPNTDNLKDLGLNQLSTIYWNLTPAQLVKESVDRKMGVITDTGALAIDTGEFTGRSPKDRFIVCDNKTEDAVWWGDINIKFSTEKFNGLYNKMIKYFEGKDVFVRDAYACSSDEFRLNLRVINEYPWSNHFANNMFIEPTKSELADFNPEWHILNAPGFLADPETDGTRQHNFAVIDFTKKMILIGGTGYTGEIKKGIFSVLNFILPHEKNTLSMHCSANLGKDDDTAIFFGLSGTGKTTLSADPERQLIGDDEHGWSGNTVFNFEGGCYAKCIDLTEEKEPQIWNAIKEGSILENINFIGDSKTVDFEDKTKTENTRVSYPIDYIDNIAPGSKGKNPKNIFFLTADAFGVLPPISKLTKGQAMFHFISGYTAKVAGTEAGITEPVTAFSACFGAPFLPLHPTVYAEMLGEKMTEANVNVWLINTGWTGGPYGIGKRMKLSYTRAMITAALNGELDNVEYNKHEVFGLKMPSTCPNVPTEVLNPKNTWKDSFEYDAKANHLADQFNKNFEKFAEFANEEILNAAPVSFVELES